MEQFDHSLLNSNNEKEVFAQKKFKLLCFAFTFAHLFSLWFLLQSPWIETRAFIAPFVPTDRLLFLISLPVRIMCTLPCYWLKEAQARWCQLMFLKGVPWAHWWGSKGQIRIVSVSTLNCQAHEEHRILKHAKQTPTFSIFCLYQPSHPTEADIFFMEENLALEK